MYALFHGGNTSSNLVRDAKRFNTLRLTTSIACVLFVFRPALQASLHGTKTCRAWRKLHLSLDTETGDLVASALTSKEVDDGAQVGSLLDQITGPLSSFIAGAYGQDGVYPAVTDRHPEAAVIVRPRRTAVPSDMAAITPTQRDLHLRGFKCPRSAGKFCRAYNELRSFICSLLGTTLSLSEAA
jgi:hypothetical protein